jgi:hypothetical protein
MHLCPISTKKGKDKEEVGGDKPEAQGYQDPKNVANVIFSGCPTKHAQKLTLHEILSVKPAMQRTLRNSELPISFTREDQWTSFSELGKFLLVLDPVVAGSQLTHVLIDSGNGLNLLSVSTLRKMGLNISKMLTPSKAPFYSIVLGNAATPIGSVTLPVTFRTKRKLPHRVHQVRGGRL